MKPESQPQPTGTQGEKAMPYQHILVAVDLTEECHPVVARAQALVSTSGAKLSLVHIIEPMAMAFGYGHG